MKQFEQINKGYNNVFKPNQLSLDVVVPIENYSQSAVPTMTHHLKRVQLVEQLGFKALWVRDVPFHVPSFGDAGQTFDPFTYLGFLAGQTNKIALVKSTVFVFSLRLFFLKDIYFICFNEIMTIKLHF